MSLPTSRALLNSIFTSLTSPPSSHQENIILQSSLSNPLKSLPISHKALLTTLHVLLPSPLLLQAFDLLDRGLVTKISSIKPANLKYPQETPELGLTLGHDKSKVDCSARDSKYNVFQVRSSQNSNVTSRSTKYSACLPTVFYTVYLNAWNCSCAAFAFSAFPADESPNKPWLSFREHVNDGDNLESNKIGEEKWAFGGAYLDYSKLERVPLCKHILACFLVEKWENILGTYANEKLVDHEEMASLISENW